VRCSPTSVANIGALSVRRVQSYSKVNVFGLSALLILLSALDYNPARFSAAIHKASHPGRNGTRLATCLGCERATKQSLQTKSTMPESKHSEVRPARLGRFYYFLMLVGWLSICRDVRGASKRSFPHWRTRVQHHALERCSGRGTNHHTALHRSAGKTVPHLLVSSLRLRETPGP